MYGKRIMLHISGAHGKLAGKFNSEHATGYMLSDGQGGDEIGAGEWIDFTYFAEKSSIRSVEDRKRVRAERENMGLIARVQRGHGSLQFSYNRGVFAICNLGSISINFWEFGPEKFQEFIDAHLALGTC